MVRERDWEVVGRECGVEDEISFPAAYFSSLLGNTIKIERSISFLPNDEIS